MAKQLYTRWRESKTVSQQLDTLLTLQDPSASLAERNQWLIELFYWLRRDNQTFDDYRNDRLSYPEHTRLAFLMKVLNQHPLHREKFTAMLYSLLRDNDPLTLYCDTGMAAHPSFWGELLDRVQSRFVSPSPNQAQLSALFSLLFIEERDADWIDALPADLLAQFADLFPVQHSVGEQGAIERGQRDLMNSIRILVTKIGATGLSRDVRSRVPDAGHENLEQYAFFRLLTVVNELFDPALTRDDNLAQQALGRTLNQFRGLLDKCRDISRDVYRHLDQHGVSVAIVFEVERMLVRIDRIEMLLHVWLDSQSPQHKPERLRVYAHLTAELIRANRARRSVRHLIDSSLTQLARKVVERSAATGEHYIARDRGEYRSMFARAAGGGALTAFTVFIKLSLSSLGLAKFTEGVLASLNYSFSFLAIHFAHFTLATKQPAMTAPALAARLNQTHDEPGREAFVDETFALVRSQVAAIFGNLALVLPVALAGELLIEWLCGHTVLSPDKAQRVVASFSILGPTPIYAAFTGVLLWLSSLFAGWVDNWFALHRIHDVLLYQRRLRYVFGEAGARRLADFFQRNVSGVAASISLGFLLGLLPEVLTFIGVETQVRHVTLSTGQLAVALGTLGWSLLHQPAFWLAVAGIAMIGFLNLLVSFALAFNMALGSRDLKQINRRQINRAVRQRILRKPWTLLFPPRGK